MKNSILILAITLFGLTNINAASFSGLEGKNPKFKFDVPTEDTIVSSPELLTPANVKSIEETIAEDVRITETVIEQAQPINCYRTMEEIIAEDNKIIESDIHEQKAMLLDFKKINKSTSFPKGTRLAGM